MVGIVVAGFWPSYFGPMMRGDIGRPAIIQLHGLVFVGWMALLMAQVVLAARGRIQLHRKVGRYGIAYGWLVVAMGLVVGPAASVIHVRAGEWTRDRGAGFLLITFGDMVLFGVCFAATVALLFAAVGRSVAYASLEAGKVQVYVRSFPDGGDPRKVREETSAEPRWGAGGELFFRANDASNTMWSVEVSHSGALGTPRSLYRATVIGAGGFSNSPNYEVSRDGAGSWPSSTPRRIVRSHSPSS